MATMVGEVYGWHMGFSVAGIGMALGRAILLHQAPLRLRNTGQRRKIKGLRQTPVASADRDRIKAVLITTLFTAAFSTGFQQRAGVLTMGLRCRVDPNLLRLDLPVSWSQ